LSTGGPWGATVVDHYTLCCAAALLLPPDAALSHRSAAMLHNAFVLARDQPVEVTAEPGVRSQPGLYVVRSPFGADDVVKRGGLPVTGPLRTAPGPGHGRGRRRRPSPRARRRSGGARRVCRGARGLAGHQRRPPGGRAGPDPLPEPVVQYEVFDAVGRLVARLDLACPEHRVGWSTTATIAGNGPRSGATPSGSTA
jgi:hypothetical protein